MICVYIYMDVISFWAPKSDLSVIRIHQSYSFYQAISNESQQFVNGAGNSTPLASEISNLDDPTFKVGKLTVEERREKIHRYMKKRNERNFSKKIKVHTITFNNMHVTFFFVINQEIRIMHPSLSIGESLRSWVLICQLLLHPQRYYIYNCRRYPLNRHHHLLCY